MIKTFSSEVQRPAHSIKFELFTYDDPDMNDVSIAASLSFWDQHSSCSYVNPAINWLIGAHDDPETELIELRDLIQKAIDHIAAEKIIARSKPE